MKIKNHQKKSLITETLKNKASKLEEESESLLLFSFKHFDNKQSESVKLWIEEELFEHTCTVLFACSGKTSKELEREGGENARLKIYGKFPPKDKTEYEYPKHLQDDVEWASIRLTGRQRIIGHVFKNIFYIVFLDKEHKFWESKKRNT